MVKFTSLLPSNKQNIKEILSGTELLLAFELDNELQRQLGERIELDVSIAKEVSKNGFFSLVRDLDEKRNNKNNDVSYKSALFTEEQLALPRAPYGTLMRKAFDKDVSQAKFEVYTDEKIVYSFNSFQRENMVLHNLDREYGYVALMARILVDFYKRGIEPPKIEIAHRTYSAENMEYDSLLILKLYGNKIFEDILEVNFAEDKTYQPNWSSYREYCSQIGRMLKTATPVQKFKYLNKKYEVGDVVLLYKRTKLNGGSTGVLKNCYPAVIQAFDKNSITLEYYPNVDTLQTRYFELSNVEEDLDTDNVDSIYREEDYKSFVRLSETFPLISIGINDLTYTELTFILDVLPFDGKNQYYNIDGVLRYVDMDTIDTVYAVFEDRGVPYNKERYIKKYFTANRREPLHDKLTNMDYDKR